MPDYSVDQELVQSGEGSLTVLEARFVASDDPSMARFLLTLYM